MHYLRPKPLTFHAKSLPELGDIGPDTDPAQIDQSNLSQPLPWQPQLAWLHTIWNMRMWHMFGCFMTETGLICNILCIPTGWWWPSYLYMHATQDSRYV